jgi:3-deoxy-D-manno-octulosonate 8-phosphate phosphatase (KDO 8-P phosphatase)
MLSLAGFLRRAREIKLIIIDVDGVLTDGSITYSEDGKEIKSFNVRDGFAIKRAEEKGIKTGIISGRKSTPVDKRAKELNMAFVIQGNENKKKAFYDTLNRFSCSPAEVCFIGDDLVDLPLIKKAGLGVTTADAPRELIRAAHWVTSSPGGKGAVRELIEAILKAQGKWGDKA